MDGFIRVPAQAVWQNDHVLNRPVVDLDHELREPPAGSEAHVAKDQIVGSALSNLKLPPVAEFQPDSDFCGMRSHGSPKSIQITSASRSEADPIMSITNSRSSKGSPRSFLDSRKSPRASSAPLATTTAQKSACFNLMINMAAFSPPKVHTATANSDLRLSAFICGSFISSIAKSGCSSSARFSRSATALAKFWSDCWK